MTGALVLDRVTVGYERQPVVRDVSLRVEPGTTVAMIGANGAGKTTVARSIAGLIRPWEGAISLGPHRLDLMPGTARAALGVAMVPEQRCLFAKMSVADNLALGAFRNRRNAGSARALVLDLFPVLGERLDQLAGTMSGGEQQMLAIGRALMSGPSFLVLDEPSLGLAPRIVSTILTKIGELNAMGVGVLLIEQNARAALNIATTAVVLERGRILLDGEAALVRDDPAVAKAYLGGVA